MRIVLFCENKYAIDILKPLQDEAEDEGVNDILWYVHQKRIPDFPLKDSVNWTNSIQQVYDFFPDVVFVPGNIVPYYLRGVKIQIFHGYAAEKKDHWIIRRYFDTYFTQGPYFTRKFMQLSYRYKDFEVLETGWTRQDWISEHRCDFENDKYDLLQKYGKKQIVLYAPTFSPKLTSLPFIKDALIKLTKEKNILLMMKFHPLTSQEWIDEYRQLANEHDNMIFVDDFSVTKYLLMADVMISDTSSTIYEFLLLNKPVVTLRAISKDIYWKNPFLSVEQKDRLYYELKKIIRHEGVTVDSTAAEPLLEKYIAQILAVPSARSKEYCDFSDIRFERQSTDPKLIAYYLPQMHPTPENDAWWGRGVTEWNNVSRAVPQYVGHYQPRLPGELGFYDLRLKENLKRQMELAKMYGLYGFSWYYYWFDGKRLLDRPLDMYVNDKTLDFPFCICWANESWTKGFFGSSKEVIMNQSETVESYRNFIKDAVKYLQDDRYITVQGKKLLIVYKPQSVPD